MSNDRRRQQRAERVRQRRASRPLVVEPRGSDMALPGVFGWMQRNGRLLIIFGILVMVFGLGSTFLATHNSAEQKTQGVTATATAAVEGGKPVGTPGPDGIVRRYNAAPPLTIDPKHSYQAVIHTEKGDITLQLQPDKAPGYVNNFVFLARNNFFNGLTFHRVVSGFVAQGGDPLGNGTGGPGYVLPQEKNDVPFDTGIISMASSAAGVSGSQFFITLAPQPALEPNFAAFGRVTDGLNVVQALTVRDPQQQNQPPGDRILKVDIIEKAS